ncbi:MAG: sulfite exporter TauE/SafE family protein [Hydrogenophaga sp.]|nr:sulfite exporter TauE/SafE family protein [Hydrogenophaga sp.]
MDPITSALTLLAGWLIGATGIGGVLVVPVLGALEGVDLPRAIAASALAFALPGAVALWRLRGHAEGLRTTSAASPLPVASLVWGAVPGSLLGAALVHQVDKAWLLAGLATLALASGLRGLRPQGAAQGVVRPLARRQAGVLGALVGLGSGLSGTGGPVLLVPLLMALRQPLPATVAAAQAIQLPVALSAGAMHAWSGALDLPLALQLGAWLLLGSMAGQWAARRIAVSQLQRLVSLLLVATGLWLGWRLLF